MIHGYWVDLGVELFLEDQRNNHHGIKRSD